MFKRSRAFAPPKLPEQLPLFSLSELESAVVFVGIFSAICLTMWLLLPVLAALKRGWPRTFLGICVLLGVFYTLAGMKHFEEPGHGVAIRSIVPPWGTWGFWYVPFSAKFHVWWTGIVEVVGGVALIFGLVEGVPAAVTTWAARVLFVLMLCVTPANIYMLTHGALMPGVTDELTKGGKPLPLGMHVFRSVWQALLLATLFVVGQEAEEGATKRELAAKRA